MGTALAKLSRLRTAIEAAKSLDEVVDLRDQAAAMITYAKAIGERTEIVNAAVEGKLRCERKAGAFLAGMEKQAGARDGKRSNSMLPRLDDIGVTKIQSHRWQRLASIDGDEFDGIVAAANEGNAELTTAAVLRAATKGKPVNGKPQHERPGLPGCLERLRISMSKVYDDWPEDDRETLAAKLRAYADEIDRTGGLVL